MTATKFTKVFSSLLLVTFCASAQVSLTAYSKDEAVNEKNISKPRIYIVNTGSVPVSDFTYYYYFTADSDKRPVLEDYYTPGESVSLVYFGHNRYAVKYDCMGVTLYPGETLPDRNGNVVGIHYENWQPMHKSNDPSFNFSTCFQPNGNIDIQYAHCNVIPKEKHYSRRPAHDDNTADNGRVSVNVDIRVKR